MIVVAGEALIDLVPAPAPAATSESASPLPQLLPQRGGGPYNVAVALGRLGSPTSFCSRVSTDAFGAALLSGLRDAGVDTELVQRGSEPTTLAVADVGSDGSAGYGFYTEGTADRLFALPPALPQGATALSVGTCSLVLEPGASAYEALLRREFENGVFTALDPNIRPGLIADADAYRKRFLAWLPHVALLKLSIEDARWLADLGPDGDLDTHLTAWLEYGPAAIVLTRGGDGLSVWSRGAGRVSVPGTKVTVVDTIGAGDTVNAALLHRLREIDALSHAAVAGLDAEVWRDVLGFAARAAALTCSRSGAEPPYAWELSA
ncbi:carbohydrate kinase [Streptomyces sp. SID4985]|uniref:PfkB family carbohydrate kinase n=1 Tax=Streptomyces sp. SID4985 TaxID=2690292 RepID=UPI00136F5B4D|nr:carbohydrate kinase [Streptomyces sp. SID4985]